MTYAVVRATPEHAARVAADMREADAAECWAGWRHTPYQATRRSLEVSREPMAGLSDGRPFCIFGVASLTALSSSASPWMLGTRELPQHARVFLRCSRAFVGHIRGEYSILENYVDARNTLSIRWLKWLGFTIQEAVPFGPDRLPFHKFGAYRSGLHHLRAAPV